MTTIHTIERHVVVQSAQRRAVVMGQQGPQGAQGIPGPTSGAAVEVNFAFGDASPSTITTATVGKLIYGVSLHIKVPFDGTGASLTVGDAGQIDRLMASSENDPYSIGSNDAHPSYAYAVDTPITLSITPGAGATQGSGVLTLNIQQ